MKCSEGFCVKLLWYLFFYSSVSIEGNYLRFISITPAAAGRYYCSASNIYGNTTEMAEVIVNRGRGYETRPQAKNYEINEGQTVRISCDIENLNVPIRGDVYVSMDGQKRDFQIFLAALFSLASF